MDRATALEMACCGARLALFARREEPLQETAQMIRALGGEAFVVPGDTRNEESVEAAMVKIRDRYGQFDVLVNNWGGQYKAAARDITNKGFEAVIRDNLIGSWQMTRAAADYSMFESGGLIVFVTAISVSVLRTTGANDALRRKRSLSSKTEFGTSHAGHEASIWKGSSKTSRLTSSEGAGTLRSASPLACSQTWKPGFAGDCECISGNSGITGTSDSRSFAASASRSSPQRLPPVHRRGPGKCPGIRRSSTPCATTSLTLSVSPEYWFLGQLNSVEPPR